MSLALLAILGALAIYRAWPGVEIRVRETKRSPDGQWTAVVQMEIYETVSSLNEVVYAVRLKGPAQKERQGDLVMTLPVNSTDPEPSIDWSDGNLSVTLVNHQMYQYFAT